MVKHILIAEDHPLCCEALTQACHSIDRAALIDNVPSLRDLRIRLAARTYDAMLLDLSLEDSRGFVNLSVTRTLAPEMPVLVVSASDTDDVVVRARTLGAQGFLSKSAGMEEMTAGIRTVMDGGCWFPRDMTGRAGQELGTETGRLSPAQLRVLTELTSGHPNKVIAGNLGIAEPTVKSHISAIFRHLGVTNRSQAILKLSEESYKSIE